VVAIIMGCAQLLRSEACVTVALFSLGLHFITDVFSVNEGNVWTKKGMLPATSPPLS